MSEGDNELLAIDVDADDYAETAAGETPLVSRTYQSEADFERQKASYTAKVDSGNTYNDLITAVPVLRDDGDKRATHGTAAATNGDTKARLSKKEIQLLGYAVGELYYDGEYAEVVDLCGRVRDVCDIDTKTDDSLNRWVLRCHERLATRNTTGKTNDLSGSINVDREISTI